MGEKEKEKDRKEKDGKRGFQAEKSGTPAHINRTSNGRSSAAEEGDQGEHQEYEEENLRYACGCAGDPSETENCCHQGDNQE